MSDKVHFSAIAVQNTIQLFYDEENINIQKDQSPELFERVMKLLKANDTAELRKRFFEFKKELEKYTKGNFYFEGNRLRLKGDDETMPTMLGEKLVKLHDAGEDFMPLIRFWKKLKSNKDPGVRNHLYAFLSHNHIPITDNGDVICEKGVTEMPGGKLVDCHSKTIDNSIGMVVTIPREKVDSDPNRTCSHGLHVGAPEYVRKWWTSGIIVECLVNPADFVAVPNDYNNTKARVCRYQVIGLAGKDPRKNIVYKFEDIIDPTYGAMENQKKRDTGFSSSQAQDHSKKDPNGIDFTKMTGKAIIEYVKKKTGVSITVSLKNKQQIVRKAKEILGKPTFAHKINPNTIKVVKKSQLTGSTVKEIIDIVKLFTGEEIKDSKKGRAYMVDRAIKVLEKYKIKIK